MEWQENKTLKIQNLRVDFLTKTGTIQAVKGVNLTVPKGKITALVGESGSGKTTFGKLVAGLEKTFRGNHFFFGQGSTEFKRAGLSAIQKRTTDDFSEQQWRL